MFDTNGDAAVRMGKTLHNPSNFRKVKVRPITWLIFGSGGVREHASEPFGVILLACMPSANVWNRNVGNNVGQHCPSLYREKSIRWTCGDFFDAYWVPFQNQGKHHGFSRESNGTDWGYCSQYYRCQYVLLYVETVEETESKLKHGWWWQDSYGFCCNSNTVNDSWGQSFS